MSTLDYFILVVLLISAGLGFVRGIIKEILSLIAFVAAFLGALNWGPYLAALMTDFISFHPLLLSAIAYIIVFVVVLLIVGMLNLLLTTLIDKTGLSPADQGLGVLFGLLRGAVIVLALVVLASYTAIRQEPWWQASQLVPIAELGIAQIKDWMPATAEWLPN
ncbi:MAG TPA: CvpA family protein [Paenalcaligenes sp.]|nr:CvpA family protein [Paenalcaligenes sp.]